MWYCISLMLMKIILSLFSDSELDCICLNCGEGQNSIKLSEGLILWVLIFLKVICGQLGK